MLTSIGSSMTEWCGIGLHMTSAQLHSPRPNITMRSRSRVPLISALMYMYTELRCISLLLSTNFFFVDPHPRCSDARARRQPTLVPNPRDFVRTRRDIMGIWYKFLFGRPDQPPRLFSGVLFAGGVSAEPPFHVAAYIASDDDVQVST